MSNHFEGYMRDSKGRLVPPELVKDHERLEDQAVRKILTFADDLNAYRVFGPG